MKIRRIDYSPDEMIAGIAGQLDPLDFGVYWMICTLIYSRGGPIQDDAHWIAGVFKKTNPRTVNAAITRLIDSGKLQRNGAELMVNRCRTELERAVNRTSKWVENGLKGGRPSNKNNNITKPSGYEEKNLSSNHQPSTINHQVLDIGQQADRFMDFWNVYPIKKKKKTAHEIWKRKKLNAVADQLIQNVAACLKSDKQWLDGFIPHATTYLNQERWNDEIQATAAGERPETDFERAVRVAKQNGLPAFRGAGGDPPEKPEDFIARVLK